MTIQEQIDERIKCAVPGTLFFVNDFNEFDNAYVSKLLSLISSFGVIERLAKGIYYKPIITKFGIVYPSTERIIKEIAEREHAEILPTGESAQNALGLSTQVTMKPVFLTTGSPRTITIGNKQIMLKRRAPRMYAYKSNLMPILELALKSKGQKNLLIGDMNHVRKLLIDSKEKDLIWNDLSIAPVWIRKMIKNLFNEMNYEFVAR